MNEVTRILSAIEGASAIYRMVKGGKVWMPVELDDCKSIDFKGPF